MDILFSKINTFHEICTLYTLSTKYSQPLKTLSFWTFLLFPIRPSYATITLLKKYELKYRLVMAMSQFRIYQEYSQDATMVSNIFIDQYMKDANDAQIKIYLYLLRVLSSNKNCSISDLADQFNYTEKDVLRALRYWEKSGLLSLDYDNSKALIGVRLLDIVAKDAPVVSLAPVVPLPIRTEDRTENVTVKAAVEAPKHVKPQYSTDDLLRFKSDASIKELLFVVEQYLGKTLSASEMQTVMFFYDELKFSIDLIDYLFDYCVGRGKKEFRYIEKVALSWADAGITTPKEASNHTGKYDKIVYAIMKALGKNAFPTDKEAEYVKKWSSEFGFETDIIMAACEKTVLATDSHRFEYADKILSSWFKSGVHHLSDIAALDTAFEKRKKPAAGSVTQPSFKQFSQRQYDFEQLEKDIITN